MNPRCFVFDFVRWTPSSRDNMCPPLGMSACEISHVKAVPDVLWYQGIQQYLFRKRSSNTARPPRHSLNLASLEVRDRLICAVNLQYNL
jgi:hypothetical protein